MAGQSRAECEAELRQFRAAQDSTNAGGRDKAPGQLYGLLTHKTENVITFAAGNVGSGSDGNDDGDGSGGSGSVAFEIRFNIVNCVQNFVI